MFTPDLKVQVHPNYGDDATVIDGCSCEFTAGQWKHVEVLVVEALSIQSVHVSFVGFMTGDYGRLSMQHPVNANGYFSPTSSVDIGATVIPIPVDAASVIGAGYGVAVEFWASDDSELKEIRGISSIDGNNLTISEPTAYAYSTSAILRLVVGCFAPIGGGGPNHITSGFHAVGDGQMVFGSENEATAPVPAGLLLSHRFKATSEVSTRKIAISYRFRRASS